MNAPKYRSLPAVKHHREAAAGAIFKSVLGEGLLSGTDVFFLPGRYSPMLNVVRAVVVRRAIRLGMGDINCRSWSPAGFQIKNINWEATWAISTRVLWIGSITRTLEPFAYIFRVTDSRFVFVLEFETQFVIKDWVSRSDARVWQISIEVEEHYRNFSRPVRTSLAS